jgi:hypothetical protein
MPGEVVVNPSLSAALDDSVQNLRSIATQSLTNSVTTALDEMYETWGWDRESHPVSIYIKGSGDFVPTTPYDIESIDEPDSALVEVGFLQHIPMDMTSHNQQFINKLYPQAIERMQAKFQDKLQVDLKNMLSFGTFTRRGHEYAAFRHEGKFVASMRMD